MNIFQSSLLAVAITTISILPGTSYARCSSGEIANFLCETGVIDKPAANAADAAHAAMGRPLDRAAPAIAGAVGGPYAAAAAQTWQNYDNMRRMQGGMGSTGFQSAPAAQSGVPWPTTQASAAPNICRTQIGACTIPPGPINVQCWCGTAGGPAFGISSPY